jgi:hypothetical protein
MGIMASWLIIVTGLIYAVCAIDLAGKGNIALAIAFAGYSFSNVGLWMAAK